ncbi:MAG TPA: hypothetical protein VKB65_11400 [Myxococcota bacterium]|nr:hypothetical protein [Myxococcota bacterium]
MPVESLEAVASPDVPASLALIARGQDAEGRRVVVSFSPRSGGDALLGLVAHQRAAQPRGDDGAGEAPDAQQGSGPDAPARAYAVSRFGAAARRRMAFVGELGIPVEPVEAGRLLEGPGVQPEAPPAAVALPPAQVGAGLAEPAARELFRRALASLAGLAAKHAGGVRGTAAGVELVLMARRVARLSIRDGQVQLEPLDPRGAPQTLGEAGLAEAFDQLEGQLRKRLRDTRVLRGEEGLRARVQLRLAEALGLRSIFPFPLGGSDQEVLDAVGVASDGRLVVVAVRERLGLEGVGAILDAWAALQPSIPGLLADALPPVTLEEAPRLVVAAVSCDAAAARVLEGLTLELERLEIRAGRDGLPDLVPAGSAPASAPAVGGSRDRDRDRERGGRRRGRGRRGPRRGRDGGDGGDREDAEEVERGPEASDGGDDGEDADTRERAGAERPERPRPAEEERPRFAELSSFDLDDGFGLDGEAERTARPRGRGRGRRRGRGRQRRDDGDARESDEADPERDAGPALDERGDRSPSDDTDVSAAPEAPEDEDVTVDEEELELAEAPEPEAEPEPMRQERPRRAAILAHADRHSVASAMLLAREARQVEGIWVYPQSELMTFFRSVAIDLHEDVTIIVVGFQASPVRDVLQAASLYAGRLEWYDTREWPPEDLAEFTSALGTDFVDVHPGLDTPMPLVLPRCSRRSRFSDKLVDLAAARFSEHDFQRWGRVWWWRLAEIASRPGEHRNELQPLLTGRPSDLAAEAGRAGAPPPPPEVEYVGARDFRIVHFGGYAMVLLDVPAELELSLAGRIARERYGAQLSLARHEGRGICILGANDGASARPLSVGSMAQHLGEKLSWVETLPGADHVARFRIHGLDAAPERLEAVVSEIGMGRSILEG